LEELWGLVKQIPKGMCACYGDLARSLENPVNGYTVGRWMAQAPVGVPWWRVVGMYASLPIGKKNSHAAQEQSRRLEDECVAFVDDRIVNSAHRYPLT